MTTDTVRVRIGISACLLGAPVRFDAGHKRDRFLTDVLSPFVDWVPVCPEAESGLGTPRESMRLVRVDGSLRLLTGRTGVDHTDRLVGQAEHTIDRLADQVGGFVLKKDSPSCGLERVRVYSGTSTVERTGQGLFAARLVERVPALPVEEEGRLHDPLLREHFIERVFAYTRLRRLFSGAWTADDLVRFHTAHKLTLMAHSPHQTRELGRLVATAGAVHSRVEFAQTYTKGFMRVLAHPVTRGRHTNVLQHATGYFREHLDSAARADLQGTIQTYQRGLVPLIVPVTLLQHHVRNRHIDYLARQQYFEPYPAELGLRNAI